MEQLTNRASLEFRIHCSTNGTAEAVLTLTLAACRTGIWETEGTPTCILNLNLYTRRRRVVTFARQLL